MILKKDKKEWKRHGSFLFEPITENPIDGTDAVDGTECKKCKPGKTKSILVRRKDIGS